MGFLGKYRLEIILALLFVVGYSCLRLFHLLNLPIFTDEAIYIRWAQIAKADASWRFISLTDGKQPLYIWLTIVALKFIKDPLMAGRIISVIAGFFTMVGLFLVSRELFKKTSISFISVVLYILAPIALVYDRMALYDGLVATLYIWSMYVGILLVRRIRLDIAFILGFVLGAGALNKSIGLYSLYLLPANILLFPFQEKKKWRLLGKWILFMGIAGLLTEIIYAVLRLSPWFYIIKQKDSVFFYPLSGIFHMPLSFWINNFTGNFHGLLSWLIPYLTWPIILLAFVSFVFYREFLREKLLLFLYSSLPFVAFAVIAKVMYPRYIFFMSLPLLVLAAYSLDKIFEKVKNVYICILISLVAVGFMLYADYAILTNFAKAPIPPADIFQYQVGWPAGGGVREAVRFLQVQSEKGPLYIGTEGTFGLMPYSLQIYLANNKNITIDGFWPVKDTPPQIVTSMAAKMPTYVLFYQPCPSCKASGTAPQTWPLREVLQYNKGMGNFLTIYKVVSH